MAFNLFSGALNAFYYSAIPQSTTTVITPTVSLDDLTKDVDEIVTQVNIAHDAIAEVGRDTTSFMGAFGTLSAVMTAYNTTYTTTAALDKAAETCKAILQALDTERSPDEWSQLYCKMAVLEPKIIALVAIVLDKKNKFIDPLSQLPGMGSATLIILRGRLSAVKESTSKFGAAAVAAASPESQPQAEAFVQRVEAELQSLVTACE